MTARHTLQALVFSPLVFIVSLALLGRFLGPLFVFIAVFGLLLSVLMSFSAAITLYDIRPSRSSSSASQPGTSSDLPWVPKNLAQLRAMLGEDHKKFEYFSAALVIAMGEGHRFHSCVGGAGDWGIDTKLLNLHNCIVIVQSKFYADDHTVKPTEMRDFVGALSLEKRAVYGFFVTTSKFTEQALQTANATSGRVRTIDGAKIEALLLHRSREVALAWRDVREIAGI